MITFKDVDIGKYFYFRGELYLKISDDIGQGFDSGRVQYFRLAFNGNESIEIETDYV